MRLTNVRFTEPTYERLRLAAEAEGVSISAFVREAVLMRINWLEALALVESQAGLDPETVSQVIDRLRAASQAMLAGEHETEDDDPA